MRYARYLDGKPVEIIEPFIHSDTGEEVPIEERFTAEIVETLQPWPDGQELPTDEPQGE